MAIKFNVREYAANADTADVYIQRNFDQINLMVYLFDGLDFKTIFEAKMVDLLPGLAAKAEQARDDLLLRMLEWKVIDESVKEIVKVLQGGHALADKTVMDYFTDDFSGHTEVFGLFERIEEAGVDLPFLHQTAAQKVVAKRDVFDENTDPKLGSLLNGDDDPDKPGIGNLSEYDLYTRKRIDYYKELATRRVCEMVDLAKEAGVLRGQVPGGTVKASSTSKINDMACLENVCVLYAGLYCVMTGDPPGCSLDSDPHPGG